MFLDISAEPSVFWGTSHYKKTQFGEECGTLLLVVHYLCVFMHSRKVQEGKKGSE